VSIRVSLEPARTHSVEALQEAFMAQKLFIGGLSFSTSTERLREVFAAAGQVESAAVVTDRDTGRSRGFGFVEMATADEAEKAISQFNGKDLDGRQVRVEKASSSGGGTGGAGRSPRGFGGASRGGRW
jgi:cold-inducible RNA-binding protein